MDEVVEWVVQQSDISGYQFDPGLFSAQSCDKLNAAGLIPKEGPSGLAP